MSTQQPLPAYINLPLSGAAGCAAWCVAHPFELLKNKMMLAPEGTKFSAVFADYRAGGIFKGLSGGLTRQVVYASCRLGFYDPIKCLIVGERAATMYERAAAGAAAGALAAFLSSPVEVMLVMQTKAESPISVATAAKQVYAASGIGGYWRGIGPLTNRAAVVGVCQVAVYDQVKHTLMEYNAKNNVTMSTTALSLWSSGATGLFYSFITMPIEMARVKMAAQQGKGDAVKKYKNMPQAIASILRERGVLYMYSSFLPYYGRCGSHTSIAFILLELGKKKYHENRGAT